MKLLKLLWKRKWIIIVVTLLFGIAFYCYSRFMITPTYRAGILMYVNNNNLKDTAENNYNNNYISAGDLSASIQLVNTYAAIIKSENFMKDVVAELGMDINPSELLGLAAMDELLAILKKKYDFVIIDSAPACAVTDAAILARKSDGVIFVVRRNAARTDHVNEGLNALSMAGAKIVGFVFTCANELKEAYKSRYSKRGYGYGYGRKGYGYGKYGYSYGQYGYGYGYEHAAKQAEEAAEAEAENPADSESK